MSSFEKVLVKDDRLMVTDKINYAVNKGGQNVTSSQFNAISASTSSHTYNIQVPSEQTLVDRRVLWQSQVTLLITGSVANRPAGALLVNYPGQDSLSAYPLHQLCTVMTATVNNNSTSINMRDVLPTILRLQNKKDLARYNSYTPTMYDTYQNYSDGLGANNNVLGGWSLTSDNSINQRGSWILDSISSTPPVSGSTPTPITPASEAVYITFTVTEPLMISPFIYSHCKSNSQAFYGIQNMNFIFNIGDGSRVWRTANNWSQTVSVYGFAKSKLIFNFLTPHPSDLMPSRNVCGFYELPRYISSNNPTFGPAGSTSPNAEQQVSTQTIQLNQIPDKLIIFVRKAMSQQTPQDSDSFLVIKSLSINFNNMSGIGANFTQQDLFRFSSENGSNQTWYEFSGGATKAASPSGSGVVMPTSGSLVVLEFGKDIQLVEDFYASGSLGNFSLQVNLNVINQSNQTLNQTEIVMITMNSGVWVNERGTSTTYTGILTKQDVLDVSGQEGYSVSDVKRMVGGGFLDTIKSVAGKILPKLPSLAKVGLSLVPESGPMGKYAKMGEAGLSAMGYGRSGGGSSGGGYSGGMRHRLDGRLE